MNNNNYNTNYPPHPNNNPQPNYNHNNNYSSNPNYNHNTYSTYNQNTYSKYNNGYNHNPHYNHDYDTSPTSKSKKNKPSTLILIGLVFLLAGIFVTAVQFSERQKYNDIVADGNSSTAYITDVDQRTRTVRKRSSSGRRRTRKETYYYVTATYTVDKENYPISFESKKSYSQGDTFKVFYEEGNPSNYVREGDDGGLPIFGIAFIVIGGVVGVTGFKKYRDEKELKEMGLL